jgi:[acyl-carrier-protein] S-malonyltransferase
VAVSLALAHDREQAGEAAEAVAGHSLGELAAVALAGCLSAEQAIEAAVVRGRLMAEAARARPGGMVAIRCASEATLPLIVEQARQHGALAVAARNSPEQWVLSGDRAALGAVVAFAPATILPVAGPWHSPAMAQAANLWEPMLRRLSWRPPRRRLVLAGRAAWAEPDCDVPAALLGQLTQPVRWLESIQLMAGSGLSRFVTVGPGRALAGLCREILGARAEVIAG